MFWIFVTVLLLGIAAAALRFASRVRSTLESKAGDTRALGDARSAIALARLVGTGALVLWLLVTLFSSVNQIEAGQIGLVRTFGEFTGQQSPGLNIKAPYQSVTEVDGRILKRTISMTGGNKGSAVSKETQPVFAKLELNYQLELTQARDLYSQVGEHYYSRIIEPRVQQAFKAETVKYRTIDIAPEREKIREAVRAKLDKQLEQYGIDVTSLTIRDLDFGSKFMDAIEDKQAATEQAKAAEERVAITEAEAKSKIAQARGESQSAIIAAEGEARAIRIKGAATRSNPLAIELAWIEKMNPNVEVIYLDPKGALVQIPSARPAN